MLELRRVSKHYSGIPAVDDISFSARHGTEVIVVRSSLPTDQTSRWIRTQVAALDPTLPVDIATLQESEQVHRPTEIPNLPRWVLRYNWPRPCTHRTLWSHLIFGHTAHTGDWRADGAWCKQG